MINKQFFRAMIKVFIPLSLGIFLLWYLYHNQDLSAIMQIVKQGVRYEIILLSLIFGLMGNMIRGWRWCLLIDSLGKRVSRFNAIYAVLGKPMAHAGLFVGHGRVACAYCLSCGIWFCPL